VVAVAVLAVLVEMQLLLVEVLLVLEFLLLLVAPLSLMLEAVKGEELFKVEAHLGLLIVVVVVGEMVVLVILE